MANSKTAPRTPTAQGIAKKWIRERQAEVDLVKKHAMQVAREAALYAQRKGLPFSAANPSDLMDAGAKIVRQQQQKAKAAVQTAVNTAVRTAAVATNPVVIKAVAKKAVDEGGAVARGISDGFTMGLGDRASAGVQAIYDAAHGEDLSDAYNERMALERQSDLDDQRDHKGSRMVGQGLGIAGQVVATGPVFSGLARAGQAGLALAKGGQAVRAGRVTAATKGTQAWGPITMAKRVPEVTPMTLPEGAVLGSAAAGGGAVTGVTGQALSDAAQGRLGTVGDYAGAAVGGVAGGIGALVGRGAFAGAAGGATTALAQDLYNDRPISMEDAGGAAFAGLLGGFAGDRVATSLVNSLPNKAMRPGQVSKESLGEGFSELRTFARGDRTVSKGKEPVKVSGGVTKPDQRTAGGELVESKSGFGAKLSNRQKEAFRELKNYRVDHLLPSDLGRAAAIPAAAASQIIARLIAPRKVGQFPLCS